MSRVRSVLLLLASGLVVLAGLAVFLWGGIVAAFVSSNGSTPGNVPGFVFIVLGMCLLVGGAKLWAFAARAAGWDL